jgi:hypothetical protein
VAGYSTTPLVRKLGIKPGASIALLAAPEGFEAQLCDPPPGLPQGARIHRSLGEGAPFDIVLCFTSRRSALAALIRDARPVMSPACGLWVAWPKRASRLPTEVDENAVRELALPTGLVDNKVCAVDETWSGLRLVNRRELRPVP